MLSTGPVTGHVNLDHCIRWCPPGFSTVELQFFPFCTLVVRHESPSPAHTEEKGEEYQRVCECVLKPDSNEYFKRYLEAMQIPFFFKLVLLYWAKMEHQTPKNRDQSKGNFDNISSLIFLLKIISNNVHY